MPVADAMRKTTQQRIAEQNPDIPAAGGAASGGQKGESEFMKKLRQRAEQKRQNEPQPSRENMINSMLADWSSAYKALLTNYNSRFGSLTGTYKDRFIPDTGEWMKEYNAKRKELDEKARHIRGMIGLHGGSLGDDYISRVTSGLDGAAEGTEQMAQGYKAYNDFFGQFKDESEYASWQDAYFHTAAEAAADRQAWEKETREKIRTMPEGAERTELEDKLRRYERGEGEWGTYSKFLEKGDPLEKTARAYQTGFTNALMDRAALALRDQDFLDLAQRTAATVHIPDAEEAARYDQLKHGGYDMVYPERGKPYAVSKVDGAVMVYKDGEYVHPELLTGKYAHTDQLGIYLSVQDEKSMNTSTTDVRSQAFTAGKTQHWDLLTPEEILTYYGLMGQDPASAEQYLEKMQPTLNHRFQNGQTENTVKAYREAGGMDKWGMSVSTIPANLLSGAAGFVTIALDGLRGKETDFYGRGFEGMHYSNSVRGERAKEFNAAMPNLNILGLSAGDIYQAGMSGLDSLATSFVPGGWVLQGMGAGANKGYELHKSGASREQIFRGSMAAAATEALAEKIPFDKLNLLKGKDVSTWLDFGLNVLKQGGIEYGEEAVTELANGITDLFNRTSQSDWAKLWEENDGNFGKVALQVLQKAHTAGMSGFISGSGTAAAVGGVSAARTAKYNNSVGAYVKSDPAALEQYKRQAKAISETVDPGLAELADSITAESSDAKVAELVRRTTDATRQFAVGESLNTLKAEGFTAEEAEQILEIGYQKVHGGVLTNAQQALWNRVQTNPGAVDAALVWERLYDGVRVAAPGSVSAEPEAQTAPAEKDPYTQLRESIQGANSQTVGNNPAENAENLNNSQVRERMRDAFANGEITEQEYDEYLDALLEQQGLDGVIEEKQLLQERMDDAEQARKEQQTAKDPYAQLRESLQGANLNGGTNNANTQYAAGAAAAQGAADGGSVLYGSGQRNDGASAGQPAGSLGSRAGQDPQRGSDWADSRREGVRRKNLIQDIRGSAEAVSSKSQGIQTGTDNATMRIVPEEKHTEAMKAEAERIYQETGKQVRYVVGSIEIVGKDGKTRSARGITTADGIFVRLDHSTPAEKIGRHESFHGMLDAYGEFTGRKTILDGILEELRKNFTPEQIESVLTRYHEALRGVYSGDRSTVDQSILEEMLADAYAGINAFGAGAIKFSEAVQGFMRDNLMSRETTQDNGTEQPTGPPSQNRTFQEEIEAQMRGEPAGQKENTAENGGERYSFIGYAEDGKGMYRSNFPKGTPKKAKGERILRYIQDVWSRNPITLRIERDGVVHYIEAEFDPTYYPEEEKIPTDASKLMGGNRHGSGSEQRVTLDLADDYYHIASEARYNYSKKESGKEIETHKDVSEWHYFVNDIYFAEFDGDEYEPYTVTINVKEKSSGHYVYSFSAEKTEKNRESSTQQTLHAVVRGNNEAAANGKFSNNSIRNQTDNVKQQIQKVVDKVSPNHAEQMQRYTELKNSDSEAAQRVHDELMDGPYATEFEEYLSLTEQLEKLEAERGSKSDSATEDDAGAYTERASLDEEVRYSLDEDSTLADKAIAKNDSLGFVDDTVLEEAKQLRERTADHLRTMKENGVAIPDDIKGNTAISNSSYDITEENTTICPRSLASEAFVDAVSEYLGRPLTVEEQIYISQDLQGRSLTPECTYCYVATDRKAYRQFLGDYIKQRDAVLEKLKADPDADVSRSGDLYKEFLDGRKDTNPMYNRFKMWVDAYKGGKPMIDGNHLANMSRLMGDINSEFGAELKPQIVDAMKYAQSASWAKKRVSYVAYDGHILNWKQNRIDKLNSHYGLRMYSFSDFHPAFVLENMQMITDAAVRGLKMLGYTKDTDFVEIFAPTGMNINISTFGFEVGGNVYENNIIGANWEKARALREQHPNVGITFVATNDTMVEWALAQEWSDVVIPFHLVRTGEAVAKAYGFENFTKESSDTKTEGWSKEKDSKYIAPTVHNNDKATYLAALKKNNLKPRFERWIDDPNYMKLVNECRQSASQSRPVQPVFNEEAIDTVLAKLKANGYYQPVGGSVERMYEIAAQVAENMGDDLKAVDTSKSGWAQDLPARYSIDDTEVDVDEAKEKLVDRTGVVDTGEESAAKTSYDTLPTKARYYVRRAERQLLDSMSKALSVPYTARRDFLAPVVRAITNEYLQNGSVSRQTVDGLFQRAYAEGVVVDEEFYSQYKHIKDHLRTTAVTIAEQDRSDIAEFNDFRRRTSGLLRIRNEGGLPVDTAYQELQGMAPELFPDNITRPADQLQRMYEVAGSIVKVEHSLDRYYGADAAAFKRDARHEFDGAIDGIVKSLRDAKRYMDDRAADSGKAPATVEEAEEAWKALKAARRHYEKVIARNLLTEHDQRIVGDLLYGRAALENLDPKRDNVEGITDVYEAKLEYARWVDLLAEYKKKLKADLRSEADSLLETANEWNDKGAGWLYSRETMRRNVFDIVPDRDVANAIVRKYFEPVAVAEAAATRFKNKYRELVAKLDLSRDVRKGDTVSEAHAVQLLGEAMDNIAVIERARGHLERRDGKTLTEWQAVIKELWESSPSLDKTKIEGAVQTFREIYDDLFQQMNRVRVQNGYEPVNYRSGYFPHFQPGESDGILAHFGRIMGISTEVTALPTTINGLTHTFRPGIQWFGNAQERLGFNTAYDAIEGFDKYIEGVASVIHQTDNIQRLRALASQIRYRTSSDGIREQVDKILQDDRFTEEEKQAQISSVYEHGRFSLSGFVVELDEYTNLLANKKSRRDREAESDLGRKIYNTMKWLEQRVAANMIAGNLSSALTNFIPLTQAGSRMGNTWLLRGMWNTLKAYKTNDGMVETSDFLTNRRGSDPLVRTWQDKGSKLVGTPMEFIDQFVADSIVRGAYYKNLNRGHTEAEAMHQADLFAASVMADRSKGAMPTIFQALNPGTKLFTQFQLEVNNQFSEIFKDIPRENRERSVWVLAWKLLQYFFGAWLFNELFEFLFGRRPALDPFGILNEAVGDFSGYELPNMLELGVGAITGDVPSFETEKAGLGGAVKNLGANILGELPFNSALGLVGIGEDSRFPIESAVPNVGKIWDAATNDGQAPEKRWKTTLDELAKPVTYVLPPFGGNQLSKIIKGITAAIQGGSYTLDNEGNDILQYPVYDDPWNVLRAAVMGKSALPEAQDWVDDGFDSLSAKATAVYQGMLEAGVDDRDAYALVDELRHAKGIKGVSTEGSVQRDILSESNVSAEGKIVAYCGMVATEDEMEWLSRLLELNPDAQATLDVATGLRAADDLKGEEARAVRAETIANATLTEAQKIVALESFLGTEWKNEDGKPTTYAKFRDALQAGLTVDEYLDLYASGATGEDLDKILKYVDSGLAADEAAAMWTSMNGLKPAAGKTTVSNAQKWRAAVDSQDDVEDQLAALSAVMSPSQYHNVRVANNYAIRPDAYVKLQEMLPKYNEDGKGDIKQTEATVAINYLSRSMSLSTQQKAALWQLITGSTSAKNNPYSTSVGQQVIDEINKLKQSDGGNSLSFSEEIARQFANRW